MRRLLFCLPLLLAACGGSDDSEASTADATTIAGGEQQAFPDVVEATASENDDGTFDFDVTISSPYDSPERYADAFRILTPDGDALAERIITHDHATEQPFTRTQPNVEVPEGVSTVTIEGRDLANGWGGGTFEVDLG